MDVSGWTVTTTVCCKAMRFSSLRNMSSNHQPKVRTCCGHTHFLKICCTGLIAELEPRILTSSATCEQQQAAVERISSLLHEPLKVSLVVLMMHLKSNTCWQVLDSSQGTAEWDAVLRCALGDLYRAPSVGSLNRVASISRAEFSKTYHGDR